ncbi:MAG: hypothetical protein BMS9Abin05_0561 [Rhodothermia bacterium]|nr:MAG: hypothetical protein BMS9Abin05_0561 [Rhodothermia bacterium]
MVKNPVCGLMVDSKNPLATRDVGGESYNYCSSGSKEDFDREPALYLPRSNRAQKGTID